MITLLLILTSFIANAQTLNPSRNWISAIEVVDKHEFYKNNEVIKKPMNSWQLLFGVTYLSANMSFKKDCVYYKTPGDALGVLKIKTMNLKDSCEAGLLQAGDWERPGIKSLQFLILDNSLKLHFTLNEYKSDVWEIEFVNQKMKTDAELLMSSAEYKTKKLIYLTPDSSTGLKPSNRKKLIKPELCHNISESCEELSPSTCSQCENGWYETPNGCFQSPKYCGTEECGGRNAPACRRGFKYQRVRKEFDCTVDSSFAYCSNGLQVQCEGKLAICR